MATIITLPEEIIITIKSYLTNDDYHYLLNTSKRAFAVVKRKTLYFALNIQKSRSYLLDKDFQSLLLSLIVDGWKQIGLILSATCDIPKDLPIHQIDFQQKDVALSHVDHIERIVGVSAGEGLNALPKVKELSISFGEKFNDVRKLCHLSKLEIINAPNLTDINVLKGIPDLALHTCGITDFSMLNAQKQHRLIIYVCPISDVSSFSGIRCVKIAFCSELQDVSPLRGVYDLTLAYCESIKDISGLGGHYSLEISNCNHRLVGLESVFGIPYLTFEGCHIPDSSVFREARSVRLQYCSGFDVSYLQNVKEVKIFRCARLKNSVSLLKDIKEFSSNENMTNINWRNQKLEILPSSFPFSDFSFVSNLQHLSLTGRYEFSSLINEGKVSFFQQLQSLKIQNDNILQRVNGLGNIPTLIISHCLRLVDISGLGGNRRVRLQTCQEIEDVSSLATVPIVEIINCRYIKDCSSLPTVPRLKVISG